MKLGFCVIDDRYAEAVTGLLQGARARGWETRCFLTDRGVFLLRDPAFQALMAAGGTHFSVCELSIERYAADGISGEGLEDRLIIGGQYQNAELVRECDRVLVF
jgi:predicted peroxiredoxin